MNRAQRKRRAAIGAIALLEWRTSMARENGAREKAEREMMQQFDGMIAEMRAQADKPRAASQAPCTLITAMVRGDGAAGAV
jgi:hypothetical protein